MKTLDNTVAIITGGALGIGAQTVKTFAERGARVVLWDVNEEQGKELENEICQQGGIALFQNVNVSDMGQIQKAVSDVVQQFGRVDVLINNAGITRDASFQKMTSEQWQQVLDINLTGIFNCCKAVSPIMIQQQYGRIINTSSIVGLHGNYGQANYAAAKAGAIAFTKTLARELGKYNITVNAVAPGFIATDMIKTIPDKVIDMMKDKVPLKRLGTAQDVAGVYAFLASSEASFISGSVIQVDGGLTI